MPIEGIWDEPSTTEEPAELQLEDKLQLENENEVQLENEIQLGDEVYFDEELQKPLHHLMVKKLMKMACSLRMNSMAMVTAQIQMM